VTCVECGAEMHTARVCQGCGAPLPPGVSPAPDRERAWSGVLTVADNADERLRLSRAVTAWVVGILNFFGVWFLIGAVATYLTQGSPSQAVGSYLPLWAASLIAVGCGSVPVTTVVIAVRRRRRRTGERRAIASDRPLSLPGTLE